MSLGFVMLCHTALDRAAQIARYWATCDCPVVIHVDKPPPGAQVDQLRKDLADLDNIRFSPRHACEWGTWGIVAATQAGARCATGGSAGRDRQAPPVGLVQRRRPLPAPAGHDDEHAQ